MEKEQFPLPALGYVYLAGIIVGGIFLFWYGIHHGLTTISLTVLGTFTVLGIAGLLWIRSSAHTGEIRKDREVTEKELAECEENPRMWVYLRIMCGLMGMGIGAMAVVLLYGVLSPGGSRHNPGVNALIPDFSTYLVFTGIAIVGGFILFYLVGHFIIFKKQPEGK